MQPRRSASVEWLEPRPIEVPSALRDAVGGHPLIAETLARRNILTPGAARAFLDPSAYTSVSPGELPELVAAVDRVRQAIQRQERIAIWGDFDADGQTATALLLETLVASGARVTSHVPTRQQGHGLHKHAVERLVADGAQLILTCDTGVTAHGAVAHVNHLGAEVIITDHHVPDQHLPPALAVVNPHRLPPGHPLEALTGVGVAYQLASALNPTGADDALDLVALGTVADVGTLTGDNRYLVQRGIEVLRRTERHGLQAIYQAAELRAEGITEEHISFVLGPRLNALGRLADAADGVELLITDDPVRARSLATEVEALNARRQWLTKQVTDAALAQIEREPSLLSDYHALVLSHPTWPGGVIGIVAGRLAERFNRPAFLITTPPDGTARGSGRSVPGVNLVAGLKDCAPLLEAFGGHAGAAGFAIKPERIPEFRSALSRALAAQVETIPEPVLAIDAYVELSDLTLDLVAEINRLAPFGPGNPPLTLAVRDVHALSDAIVGRNEEHRRVTVEDSHDQTQTVFWWHGADWRLPQGRFDLALTVRASDYRGVAEVQVEWIGARMQEPLTVEAPAAPTVTPMDYRTVSNPEAVLRKLIAEREVQVWAEGDEIPGLRPRTRQHLTPTPRLIIWTVPPGPQELRAALARTQPDEVILFAHNPGLDEPEVFLRRLTGMVRFALRNKAGEVDLEKAAARTAQRVSSVQAGLEYLAAKGQVRIVHRSEDTWTLDAEAAHADPGRAEIARARLDALLAETDAYRTHYQNAPAETLIR